MSKTHDDQTPRIEFRTKTSFFLLGSEETKLQGITEISDGIVTILNSRNGNVIHEFPVSNAKEICLGDFPGQDEGPNTNCRAYLIADIKLRDTEKRIWIELFNMEKDDNNIYAEMNDEYFKCGVSDTPYLDVAEELTSELRAALGIDDDHFGYCYT